MASEARPCRHRRLRKASDLSTVTTASPLSKRICMGKKCTSYEDRISTLPEEILLIIIGKLDTRTTVTTIILSKRWRHLPRRLPTSYNLAVDDLLPPRYHRLKRLNMEAKAGYEAEKNLHKLNDIYAIKARHERWMAKIQPLTAILERYERRAMRRYVKQVNAFLLVPEIVRQRRPVQKLRLQMLGRWHENIDEWVTTSIAKWGVEDFEFVVDGCCLSYDLEQLDAYRNLRLKRLALSNCEPVCAWNCLTVKTLTKLSLVEDSYIGMVNDILANCVQLTDFRLASSSHYRANFLFNVPSSKLKNLQVDRCNFGKIYLMCLPCLETFVCCGRPTKLYYGEVPQLRHVRLDYFQTEDNDIDDESGTKRTYPPSKFFKRVPSLDCLVLQFRGPQMWIEPFVILSEFSQLKKLFIANVPMNWDILWILLVLDATPVLESFHVHFDNSSEERSAGDLCASLDAGARQDRYHCLKELIVVGFEGLGWQTGFVRLIMKRSPLLRRVHLLDGHVRDDEQELGALQIVPRHREWHECERDEVLEDLTTGFHWPPQIILE
ncbi:unnamed protein product [Urochloa humidicola]